MAVAAAACPGSVSGVPSAAPQCMAGAPVCPAPLSAATTRAFWPGVSLASTVAFRAASQNSEAPRRASSGPAGLTGGTHGGDQQVPPQWGCRWSGAQAHAEQALLAAAGASPPEPPASDGPGAPPQRRSQPHPPVMAWRTGSDTCAQTWQATASESPVRTLSWTVGRGKASRVGEAMCDVGSTPPTACAAQRNS